MGSQCYLKCKSIHPERFVIVISNGDETKDYECLMNSEFEMRFHFPGEYEINILPFGPIDLWNPQIGYLTVTNVSDFCWMILNFSSYFKDAIKIIESRPDPIFMLKQVLTNIIKSTT